MATIPRMERDQPHLPGIDPKDYKQDALKKPETYEEAMDFICDRRICKSKFEPLDRETFCLTITLKTQDDDQESNGVSSRKFDIKRNWEDSSAIIIKNVQKLWFLRHISVMELEMSELIELLEGIE